jgi:hypothetical protein
MMRELLRHVEICAPGGTYRLQTWDTGRTLRPQSQHCLLAYRFTDPGGTVLFEGDEFGASPLEAIDADSTLRGLLGFLCAQPGDVGREYFEGYTPEQMAFAESYDAEIIGGCYAREGEDAEPFRDLEVA